VSANFAALYGVKVGDEIEFHGESKRGSKMKARVVGTVTDYIWNRGTIIMDLAWLRAEYGDQQVSMFDLFLAPDADPETVRDELMERFGEREALFVLTRDEIHRDLRATMQKVYALAYAQQVIVGLVSLLGVVSALFISVLQRRRELGLLRAVGATRRQILSSVLAEAVLMGVIGAVVGFGIGLLLEWYVLDVLILDESGFQFALRVPWLEAGVVTVVSVVLATLAGLWPAYHATRLRIPEAIAYE
jgi:putative ABC transport system permease protein